MQPILRTHKWSLGNVAVLMRVWCMPDSWLEPKALQGAVWSAVGVVRGRWSFGRLCCSRLIAQAAKWVSAVCLCQLHMKWTPMYNDYAAKPVFSGIMMDSILLSFSPTLLFLHRASQWRMGSLSTAGFLLSWDFFPLGIKKINSACLFFRGSGLVFAQLSFLFSCTALFRLRKRC